MSPSKSTRKMQAVRAIRPKSKRRPLGTKGNAVRAMTGKGGRRKFGF